MAANQSARGGVRYTMIYQDAASVPSNAAAASYNLSNPLPAGLIEQVGLRVQGTYTAGAPASASTFTELFSGVRLTFNGNQWCNIQTQANDAGSVNQSRFGALLQDIGGMVVEELSATEIDCMLWIPCGMNMGNNSRFELALNYIQSAAAITNATFEIWCKYGKSTNQTIITNQTSQQLADGAQTMVSVKIPNIKGATVAGIAIQGATAKDNLVSAIPKILGDFAMTPTYLRGISGADQNGYQFASPNGGIASSLVSNQWSNAIDGYYFLPLYNATVVDGSIVLLMTVSDNEFYTFTPILNLPTGGSGERLARQTSGKATGSKGAILSRAEDQ
tara:strand:+ start:403 stop:1401 length:999 start_codon:yes stop_codon:yes gene_type:complete